MFKQFLILGLITIPCACSFTFEKLDYPIQFEILARHHPPAGGLTLMILVSENESQQDVMALAEMLFDRHTKMNKFFLLHIFDSKEAYLNRDNLNYPKNEYWKHFLVDACYNPNTGYKQNPWWVAENRGH